MTEEQYLAFDNAHEGKHWFVNGQIYAMAGGTPRHSLICNNVGAALGRLLRDRPCVVFQSDLRVNVRAAGLYNYPDVTVVCGKIERHPKDKNTIVNPTLIVEVLSPGTEGDDRGPKATHYRSLPSLKEYLIVSSTDEHVEHYRRLDDGRWLLTEATGRTGKIELSTIEGALSLADVYDKTEMLDEGVARDESSGKPPDSPQ